LRNIISEGVISLLLKASAAPFIFLEISSPVAEVRFIRTFWIFLLSERMLFQIAFISSLYTLNSD